MLALGTNEKIISIFHRHNIILFFGLTKALLAAITPTIAVLVWDTAAAVYKIEPAYIKEAWFFVSLVWLISFCAGILTWFNWHHDLWILTNESLIDIRQKTLYQRETALCSLVKVKSVNASINGILQTFFKFGDVSVITDDEASQIVFKDVPSPDKVQEQINQAYQKLVGQDYVSQKHA